MSKKRFSNLAALGNFTKNAVENFEENIVSKRNYLEKVNEDLTSKK